MAADGHVVRLFGGFEIGGRDCGPQWQGASADFGDVEQNPPSHDSRRADVLDAQR